MGRRLQVAPKHLKASEYIACIVGYAASQQKRKRIEPLFWPDLDREAHVQDQEAEN